MSYSDEIAALRETVLAYNGALRSAYAVATRSGSETNWPAFLASITKVIDDNHETFVKAMRDVDAVRRAEDGHDQIGGADGRS